MNSLVSNSTYPKLIIPKGQIEYLQYNTHVFMCSDCLTNKHVENQSWYSIFLEILLGLLFLQMMSNNNTVVDLLQLKLPANAEWLVEPLLQQMDYRRERKTSGESSASDSSETASCRPYYLPQTPADCSSSQAVRSAGSSSASRVGYYSRSPAGWMSGNLKWNLWPYTVVWNPKYSNIMGWFCCWLYM